MKPIKRQKPIDACKRPMRCQVGFTLTELLVTISIMSIIATMGGVYFVPQLRQLEANNAANEIKSLLISSQQDALIYRNTVTLCVADSRHNCVPRGGKTLLSFIDSDNNHQYEASVDQLNEQRKLSLHFGELVTSVGLDKAYVNLQPSNGRPIGYMGSIKYCPTDGNTTYQVRVSFNITGIIKIIPYDQDAFTC